MNENVESMVLARLAEMREQDRLFREEVRGEFGKLHGEVKSLRSAIGAQSVLTQGMASYVYELAQRVEELDPASDDDD